MRAARFAVLGVVLAVLPASASSWDALVPDFDTTELSSEAIRSAPGRGEGAMSDGGVGWPMVGLAAVGLGLYLFGSWFNRGHDGRRSCPDEGGG